MARTEFHTEEPSIQKQKEELRGEEDKGLAPSFSLEHLMLAEANEIKEIVRGRGKQYANNQFL